MTVHEFFTNSRIRMGAHSIIRGVIRGWFFGTKSVEPQADMSALEGEIDQLVYQLYGLSPEEINIVEGK